MEIMEFCNEEEARRAFDIAERKLSENNYVGAKKFVNKAQSLYPNLDGLKQVVMMIDVYISASNKINGEADWYGILGVDPLADDEAMKKQFKKLALLLHPDKNKFNGAEGAFKLVLEASCVLSDKVKRISYDQNRKSKEAETRMQKPPKSHKPASNNGNQKARGRVDPNTKAKSDKHASADSSKQRTGSIWFWTMCSSCKTPCEYVRDFYLNRAILCPNCGQTYIATEKTPWASSVKPVNLSSSPYPRQKQQWSGQKKATNKKTNGAFSSERKSSTSASATQKTPQASAKGQATNKTTNGASSSEKVSSPSVSETGKSPEASFVRPVVNLSSSTQQQQQQWGAQNQSTSQNTSGGTYSERNSSSTVRISFSFPRNCSVSVKASSKAQESLKRSVLEESQEKVFAAERILKKPRRDVR